MFSIFIKSWYFISVPSCGISEKWDPRTGNFDGTRDPGFISRVRPGTLNMGLKTRNPNHGLDMATIECRFTLKGACDMKRTYSQINPSNKYMKQTLLSCIL